MDTRSFKFLEALYGWKVGNAYHAANRDDYFIEELFGIALDIKHPFLTFFVEGDSLNGSVESDARS